MEVKKKGNNMYFFDAHFHLMDLFNKISVCPEKICHVRGISCVLDEKDFLAMEKVVLDKNLEIKKSFGIHPLDLVDFEKKLVFMEKILREKRIHAVGEIGFDFYTHEGKMDSPLQSLVFEKSVDLAIKYGYPVIIHNRKALDKMFSYSDRLAKLPWVIFHSFPFTSREAESLLDKKINAYFSFGKPIINGNKRQIDCIKNLPLERILMETDAPYQALKGEYITSLEDIKKIYGLASKIRGMDMDDFVNAININVDNLF